MLLSITKLEEPLTSSQYEEILDVIDDRLKKMSIEPNL